ncbi:Thiol-disulfide oxidoreductase ResA [Rubripirellula amarantea]|uniref:Thiol-disulfide oxidoreductase ResA n=1 Tax=Rubripirellula amarantea TaxID=2527999 RepID=A0A5C5WBK9_9BACT|nr:TlpA disulfide reductase family protein [Rubripirellula amarantea]TWT47867.1 Thiol-disulfide oxidoreductase ResA [Rubripirellula amarantea]
MTRYAAVIFVAFTFVSCNWVHSQDASALSEESKSLLGMLARIQQSDDAELQAMATTVKELPEGKVDQALRIKAAGMIGGRLMELKKTDAAAAQFLDAVKLPHASGQSAQGCANMWSVAMDKLAYHLRDTGKSEEIIPTLDQFTRHSESVCFKATFADLRQKWLLYTGDENGSKEYLRKSVLELFPLTDETAVHELVPLYDLVKNLGFNDRDLRRTSLDQIAESAETAITSGESLEPFSVFTNCRWLLCKNAIAEGETDVDITRYSAGVEELSQIAFKHASEQDSKGIQLLLSSFEKQMEAMKPSKLIGKLVPEVDVTWIAPAEGDSFEKFRGKVVVLDFWAIWCGPCVASFPKMQSLQDRFKEEGLVVVGVTNWYGYEWDAIEKRPVRSDQDIEQSAIDSGDHAAEVSAIREFLKEHKVNYPQLAVGKKADASFGVESLPTIIVVDKNGVIQKVLTGSSEATHASLSRMVNELLNE